MSRLGLRHPHTTFSPFLQNSDNSAKTLQNSPKSLQLQFGQNSDHNSARNNYMQGLSGLLTKMQVKYGSVPEMIESADWDQGRTDYALTLLDAISVNIQKMQTSD